MVQDQHQALIQGILRSIVQDCDQVASACQLLRQHGIDYASDPRLQRSFRNLQQYLPERPSKLLRLKEALSEGHMSTVAKEFPIGTIIPDIWKNVQTNAMYSIPHIIVDYGNYKSPEKDELRQGAILLRQYLLPVEVPFSSDLDEYKTSHIHRWLNGQASVPSLPSSLPPCEPAPKEYPSYSAGCSPELLQVVSPISQVTREYRDGKPVLTHYDSRFFLPSRHNLNLADPDGELNIGEVWSYFAYNATRDPRQACPGRVFCGVTGIPDVYQLKDVYMMDEPDGYRHRQGVDTQGCSISIKPTYPHFCTVACAVIA